MATKQDQAIGAANKLIGIMAGLQSLRAQVNDYVTAYNNEAFSTTWNNLATCAQKADGSLGAADSTPNTANPIDTRVVTTLQKALTATQLVNAVATLQDLQVFLTGSNTLAQLNRNANVDNLAS